MSTSTVSTGFTPGAAPAPEDGSEPVSENMGTVEFDGKTYYYYKVGTGDYDKYYYFESSESRQNFLEWVSASTGVEIDDIGRSEMFEIAKQYEMLSDRTTTQGQVMVNGQLQTVTMVFMKPPLDTKLNAQANVEFFGGDIPYFSDGSAAYLNNREFRFSEDPANNGARLAGLAGSARFLFDSNYGDKETTLATGPLDPDVEALCKSLFGEVPITQEHLNILKVMGLVSGDATQGASTWKLTSEGQEAQGHFENPDYVDYLASMAINNLTPEDLMKAAGASTYFSDTGYAQKPNTEPPEYYTAADVEKLAQEAYGKMNTVEEPLPPGVTARADQQEALLKLIINLLGLPPNTTWEQLTPAQINTAIAVGLIGYDKETNTLFMTANGATYSSSKVAAPATTPPEGTAPANNDANLKAFWDAMYIFYTLGGPLGADGAEVELKGQGVRNDRFGTSGIGSLAGADPADNDYWNEIGLGHLSLEDRAKLVQASKDILMLGGSAGSGGYLDQISNMNGGSGLGLNVFREAQMRDWLSSTHGDWQGDGGVGSDERARNNFNDSAFAIPESFVYDPAQLKMSDETKGNLDRMCTVLFGEAFSAMTPDEQRKALYILTTSFNVFAYEPPVYADVATSPTGDETTQRVISPGMLYTRPGFTVPGDVTITPHTPPESEESEEEEEDDGSYWYGGS